MDDADPEDADPEDADPDDADPEDAGLDDADPEDVGLNDEDAEDAGLEGWGLEDCLLVYLCHRSLCSSSFFNSPEKDITSNEIFLYREVDLNFQVPHRGKEVFHRLPNFPQR